MLITGCSTGIGRAAAVALAAAGYRVVATARDPATLDGLGAASHVAAGRDRRCIDPIRGGRYARALRPHRRAGQQRGVCMRGAVEEVDVAAVAQHVRHERPRHDPHGSGGCPVMRRQRAGRIINVGSLAGKLGGPANGTYAASKHAVEALNDAMRWELAPFGIQVILVRPGRDCHRVRATRGTRVGSLAAARGLAVRAAVRQGARRERRNPRQATRRGRRGATSFSPRSRQSARSAVSSGDPLDGADWPWRYPTRPRTSLSAYCTTWTGASGRSPKRADAARYLAPRRCARRAAQEIAEGVYRLSVYGANVYFVRSGCDVGAGRRRLGVGRVRRRDQARGGGRCSDASPGRRPFC